MIAIVTTETTTTRHPSVCGRNACARSMAPSSARRRQRRGTAACEVLQREAQAAEGYRRLRGSVHSQRRTWATLRCSGRRDHDHTAMQRKMPRPMDALHSLLRSALAPRAHICRVVVATNLAAVLAALLPSVRAILGEVPGLVAVAAPSSHPPGTGVRPTISA